MAKVLDPVLTAGVFAAGQTGLSPVHTLAGLGSSDGPWPRQSGSIIWCAGYGDLRAAYPLLPQAAEDPGIVAEYACVDLTVVITRGVVTEVDFEGRSLAETFAALGRHDEAHEAERLLGTSAQAASAVLAELLLRLLAPEQSTMLPQGDH